MISLPPEVLLLIFSNLLAREKLECMTVCRQWHNIILDGSLFKAIFIHHEQQLQQLIERVNKDPIVGTKVEQLRLRSQFKEDIDDKVLIQLFPNIRRFSNLIYGPDVKCTDLEGQRHPWCDRIESMSERSFDLQTKVILGSGLCEKLTSITTTGTPRYKASDLFGLLKSAPVLSKLHSMDYHLTYVDLELLHSNAPMLKSLVIEGAKFKDTLTPLHIEPATLLKSFRCFDTTLNLDDVNGYLSYTSEKYTHLEDVEFDARALDYIYSEVDENDDCITRYPIPLTKMLGPQLKSLSIYMDKSDLADITSFFDFNVLDESECQIERLDLNCCLYVEMLKEMAESRQVQYIQSLSVAQLSSNGHRFVSFEALASFTKLKELTLGNIDYRKMILNLTDIIGKTGESSLETLRLYNVHLKLDSSSTTLVYPLLSDLTLSDIDFEPGTDALISRSFPNLRRLKLRNLLMEKGSLRLPSTDLFYLEIINQYVQEAYPILVTTLGDGQQRVYNAATIPYDMRFNYDIPEEDLFMLPSVYSVPFDKSKHDPLATIECNSIKNFVLINSSLEEIFFE